MIVELSRDTNGPWYARVKTSREEVRLVHIATVSGDATLLIGGADYDGSYKPRSAVWVKTETILSHVFKIESSEDPRYAETHEAVEMLKAVEKLVL
jgi:hypothetical protein